MPNVSKEQLQRMSDFSRQVITELALQIVNVIASPFRIKAYDYSTPQAKPLDKSVIDYITKVYTIRPRIKQIKPLVIRIYGVTKDNWVEVEPLVQHIRSLDRQIVIEFVQSELLDPQVLNHYGICYVVSCDGSTKYGDEYINSPEIAHYLNVRVDSVISDVNTDYYKIKDLVESTLGSDVRIDFRFAKLDCFYADFDMQDYKKSITKVVSTLAAKIMNAEVTSFEHSICQLYLDKWKEAVRRNRFENYPGCMTIRRMTTLDFAGNMYLCPGLPSPIEHANTNVHYDTIEFANKVFNSTLASKPQCNECEYQCMCHGGCPLVISSVQCEVYKVFFEAILSIFDAMDSLKTEIEL